MRITEIAPPGREKQVKALKKKFDDKGAPYAIAWAQHNKHGKPSKKESINFNSEHDEVKAILDKHGITKSDDIEYGSAVYQDLFDYFANSGEMPYGVMKARDGDPDQWIADRLDDLGLVEIADVPTQKGRDAKPNVLTPRAMNVVKKQIKKDANKQRRADSKKAVDVEEAPFGAVKKAINKAKKVVGRVPGLGDVKTKADAEANIGTVANKVWKDYLQFKQSDPDAAQVKGWFRTNHGMDVEPDANANVGQDEITPAIKKAIAAKDSKTAARPDASPDDAKDVKVKMDLLKKSDPNANAATMVAIKKMAAGDNIDPTRQQALQPLVSKIAKALNNPGKANLLSRALAESLSQSDLSKLDMLAREGMVPKNKVARFKTAMRTLAKGKDLPISYKDDVIEMVSKLSKIITKPSVMGMIRKGLRESQDPKNTFDKWVKKAKKEYDI